MSQKRSGVPVKHALFILGGALIGYGIASALIPDEPDVVSAILTAVIGLSALIVGQQTACSGTEQDA